ncbi:putative CALMODULIN-BINDING PROTEIN60 [Helianthus annuus]|uniref:CALMODULIN-BINDING PROTEIN60 n=1 Tax=Helianthus annuus TaxID=4232 RepID=A0A9K3E2X4_HELAN|nr:putative CALMODULIN-BINDING PROTEIN60 [Helianthus annuus]KAJ0832748.1 putative CALMODULIN-BINDING PROTEIN60 [Helianthus annuus]
MSEREGKQRILQGNTCLQLNKGVCYVRNKISFTHSAEHTRNSLYRLVAVVVDADLMNGVEVATTEAFVMKDRRYICKSQKHVCPSLSDKVCYLKQIGYKGPCYTRLKDTDVCTLKDLLRLLYTNPKRHEEILELKASCKFWDEIVKSAQASNGTFLYLDPRDEQKTGVVLDVKLQLKVLIVEPHRYISQCHISNVYGNDFNIHRNFNAGT